MLVLGLPDEASTSFRRAVERADGLRQAALQWPALDGLANALQRSVREEESQDARQRAREVIESVAAGLGIQRRSLFLDSPTVLSVLQAAR